MAYLAKPHVAPTGPLRSGFGPAILGAWISGRDGTALRDYSGNRNDAPFYGSGFKPSYQSGPYGSAFTCDGTTNHDAKTTKPFALNPNAGSVLAVFKAPPYAVSTSACVFSNSGDATHLVSLELTGSIHRLRFQVSNGSTTTTLASAVMASGWYDSWHTAACRWGADGFWLWIDGVIVASSTTPFAVSLPASDYLEIGGRLGTVMTGAVDSVFAFGRELSNSEVLRWSADPWWAFRPRRSIAMFGATTAAGFSPGWAVRANHPIIGSY